MCEALKNKEALAAPSLKIAVAPYGGKHKYIYILVGVNFRSVLVCAGTPLLINMQDAERKKSF